MADQSGDRPAFVKTLIQNSSSFWVGKIISSAGFISFSPQRAIRRVVAPALFSY